MFCYQCPLVSFPAAAPHQHLSRESQAQPGLPRGGREAHQEGQQYHTGWL